MSLRYSPSTGGFYDTDVHADIPDDAVYVSPSRHAELMAAQASGATISASADTGNPLAIAATARSLESRREQVCRAIRREGERRADRVMPLGRQVALLRGAVLRGADMSEDDLARFAEIEAIDLASTAIEEDIAGRSLAELVDYLIADNARWADGSAG
ncbi:hypothetical protein [Pelagerythrobacter sp.]|uniref:hypothetical protein n=1 Tax=Pelagerythrobacter sp. TaxID=2800702 RepID=UPI0035B46FBC